MHRNIRIGAAMGLLATPVALLFAIMSGGAGHGDYLWARLLYPYSMSTSYLTDHIGVLAIAVSCIQFVVYGAFIGASLSSRRWRVITIGVAILHVVCVAVLLVFPPEFLS